ncbi:hypothetical protein F5Y04DRAFT_269339 [Hypomontagnella monticulosa]|nr:hypothetical protein F5Y04DRAFT_269339 [Hypomontagnella monticulosa]
MAFSTLKKIGVSALALGIGSSAQKPSCKVIPGDPEWPATASWDKLNTTVHGRLIATVPQASVCHSSPYDNYNQTACRELRNYWDFAQAFDSSPADIASPAFQDQSCDPYTDVSTPCELGNYASYSINVTGVDDVVAGIQFARDNDVRLVIKNTGIDFLGKSTGKGALSLWTHNLKSIDILPDYKSDHYTGPAVKVGAGVIAGELHGAIALQGYRVVGGACASVGIAGGYSSGGGHSPLSGLNGMAADNVLEWEVVKANGEHVIATPTNDHSDLYWAMSGGGGGVWGVVLSMTAKLHKDGEIGGARLFFNSSAVGPDTFWKSIEAWFAFLPSYVDGLGGGNTCEYMINANSFAGVSFLVPGASTDDVNKLMQPYLTELDHLGIKYQYSSHTSPNYYVHFQTDLGPLPYGRIPADTLMHSRLFPRSVAEDPAANKALVQVLRDTTAYKDDKFLLVCQALHISNTDSDGSAPNNAVLPAFRNGVKGSSEGDHALSICSVVSYWNWTIPRSEMIERKKRLAYEIAPALEAVTPGAGSYLNEIESFYRGDWKKELYGVNYDRLLSIKDKYDPDQLFFANMGVGSDRFYIEDSGRLCHYRKDASYA